MQIHELSSPRRTDEGLGSWAKAVGKAAATGLGHSIAKGAGYDLSKDDPTASAGILDPKQKLAAVMREPAMVKLATQYADEWLKDPRSKVQAKAQAPAQAVPEAIAERVSAPSRVATKPATVPAPGFNANNLMNLPGMQKYAAPATGTQPQPGATGSRINKADPNNPNIKDQNRYVQGRAGSGTGGNATKFAKYDPASSATANAGQGIDNMVRGGVAAQQTAAPAKPTGTAMPLKPYQVPGAGTDPTPTAPVGYKTATTTTPAKPTGTAMPLKPYQVPGAGTDPTPTKPGQTATTTTPAKPTGTAMPTAPYQVPGAGTNPNPTTQPTGTTKQQIPAATPNNYMDDFEAWANQKTAMRDSTTYRTIGLDNVKNTTQKKNLKAELAAARQAVDTAQGNPTATKEAVKNYILTALAGAQLIASQNKVAAASTQPPAAQQSSNPAAAGNAASGTGQTNAANSAQPIDINALLKSAGLDPAALQKAATVMQQATRNNKLSTTGDDAIDGMLQVMGYKVS